MKPTRFRLWLVVSCALLFAAFSHTAAASTLCVNPTGSHGCYAKIQSAVDHASVNDVINVAPGTYKEDVLVGKPLSLIGAGAHPSVIAATGLAPGIFVVGFNTAGLRNVTIAGFTVKNSPFEAVLVGRAADFSIRVNRIADNDK